VDDLNECNNPNGTMTLTFTRTTLNGTPNGSRE